MIYQIDYGSYAGILRSIGAAGTGSSQTADYMARIYRRAVHEIVSRHGKTLTTSEMAVLLFVVDRTLFYSSLSTTITKEQFNGGMSRDDTGEMVFSGVNVSEMTLVKCLKSLVEMNLLHVGICKNISTAAETRVRLYAVDCKTLLNVDIMDEEKPMVLRIPKEKKQVEGRVNSTKIPPLKLGGIYTHIMDTKVSHIGSSAADSGSGVSRLKSVAKQSGGTVPTQGNIRDRIAALQQAGSTRKAEYVATAKATPPGMLTKSALQAMINPLMADFHPALPTMRVTDKPFGKLRKDLKVQPIADFAGFLEYVVSSWEQISSDHARAAKNQQRQGIKQTYTPMPSCPDFATLAYRFTYFLKCYNSFTTQNAKMGTPEKRKEEETDQLRRRIAQLQEESRSHQQVARTARTALRRAPTAPPAEPVRRTRTPPRPVVDLSEDDYIPEWTDHAPRTRKA